MRLIDATRIEQYILNNCSDNEEINAIYAEIINAPTVTAVPLEGFKSMERTVNKLTKAIADAKSFRHGHWEWNDCGGIGNYHCTVCRCIPFGKFSRKYRPDYMYCPNCGAKMDEVEDG